MLPYFSDERSRTRLLPNVSLQLTYAEAEEGVVAAALVPSVSILHLPDGHTART